MVKILAKKFFLCFFAVILLLIPNKTSAIYSPRPLIDYGTVVSAREFQIATINFLHNYRANSKGYCERENNWSGSCLSLKIIGEIYQWLLDPNGDGLFQDSYFNKQTSEERQAWLISQLNTHKVNHPYVIGKIFLPWERTKHYTIFQVDVFADVNADLNELYLNSLADSIVPNLKIPSDLGGLFRIQQLVFVKMAEKTAPNGRAYPVFDFPSKSTIRRKDLDIDLIKVINPKYDISKMKTDIDEIYDTSMMKPFIANKSLSDWTDQEKATLNRAKDFLNLTYETLANLDLKQPKNAQAMRQAMIQVSNLTKVAGMAKVSSKKNESYSPTLTITVNGQQTPLPYALVRLFTRGCALNNQEATGAVIYIDRRYQDLKKRLSGLLPKPIPDNPWYSGPRIECNSAVQNIAGYYLQIPYITSLAVGFAEDLFKGQTTYGPGQAYIIDHEFMHWVRAKTGTSIPGYSEEIVNDWLTLKIFGDELPGIHAVYPADLIDRFIILSIFSVNNRLERKKRIILLKKAFLDGNFDSFGIVVRQPGIWPEFTERMNTLTRSWTYDSKLQKEIEGKDYDQKLKNLENWIDSQYK